jgi:hypothetical protein
MFYIRHFAAPSNSFMGRIDYSLHRHHLPFQALSLLATYSQNAVLLSAALAFLQALSVVPIA